MLDIERQDKILKIINERQNVTTKELQKLVYASSSTIIRDLIKMEKQGLIRRTHGGASIVVAKDTESSLVIRVKTNIKEKNRIAKCAIQYIKNGDVIFLDSSSTVQALVPLLKELHYLTIITNGLNNALLLANESNASIYIIGGMVSSNSNSAIGSIAINILEQFNANIAIFSASGIKGNIITEHNIEQAIVKKTMIQQAKTKILLCDSSKFNTIHLGNITTFDSIDYLITDQEPDQEIIDAINKSNCKLIIAK